MTVVSSPPGCGPSPGHTLSPGPELEKGAASHPVTFSDRHRAHPATWALERGMLEALPHARKIGWLTARAPANPTVPQAWLLCWEVGPLPPPWRLTGRFIRAECQAWRRGLRLMEDSGANTPFRGGSGCDAATGTATGPGRTQKAAPLGKASMHSQRSLHYS